MNERWTDFSEDADSHGQDQAAKEGATGEPWGASWLKKNPEDVEPLDEEWFRGKLGRAAQIPINIDEVIAGLAEQQGKLGEYVDRRWDELEAREMARLLDAYGLNAVRLGRLLRDRAPLGGKMSEKDLELFANVQRGSGDVQDLVLDVRVQESPLHASTEEPVLDVRVQGPVLDADVQVEADPDAPPIGIDDVIAGLAEMQVRLDAHLTGVWDAPEGGHVDRLIATLSRNAGRLGQLLGHRAKIFGPPPDAMEVDHLKVLHILGEIWGIDLLGDEFKD